jgi:hypothetical protein
MGYIILLHLHRFDHLPKVIIFQWQARHLLAILAMKERRLVVSGACRGACHASLHGGCASFGGVLSIRGTELRARQAQWNSSIPILPLRSLNFRATPLLLPKKT